MGLTQGERHGVCYRRLDRCGCYRNVVDQVHIGPPRTVHNSCTVLLSEGEAAMSGYGTCRNCGRKRPLLDLKGVIGPTRLCSSCVCLVREWVETGNRCVDHMVKQETIGRPLLSDKAVNGCPQEVSDAIDNPNGDHR